LADFLLLVGGQLLQLGLELRHLVLDAAGSGRLVLAVSNKTLRQLILQL
jgi:hypothetical protein